MQYSKYIRNDINIKILSNFSFPFAKVIKDFNEFKKNLKNYDFGVWIDKYKMESEKCKINEIKIYNALGEELSYEDIILNYLYFLNALLREQIGVCIDKNIPRIIDNELNSLIIQRKDYKDFDENYFIANKGEVIFPMISKKYDLNLALIKLAEWKKRAGEKNLIKFQKRRNNG